MSDPQPDAQSQASQPEPPAGHRRPAGSITIRELEERDRELRRLAEQAERRHFYLRIAVAILLGISLLGTGITWQRLNASRYRAERQLRVIASQLEVQLTEVLRYAPFSARSSDPAHRKLEETRAELASPDLAKRVQAVEWIRDFLATRAPRARSRFRSVYGSLYSEFSERLDLSNTTIRQRTVNYNAAARGYNQLARAFPANLVRLIVRYPERLPPLKQLPSPHR